MQDLLNFLLVGGVVFGGYGMMAHLIFGSTVGRFATLGDSMITCLQIIMGDMSVNDELRALPGLMVRPCFDGMPSRLRASEFNSLQRPCRRS